jgi:hypothetical protein
MHTIRGVEMDETKAQRDYAARHLMTSFAVVIALIAATIAVASWLASMVKGA